MAVLVEKPTGALAGDVASPDVVDEYSDAEGFERRRQAVLEAVAQQDLGTYRRGYFSGGDPGKYLPGHAMARLALDSTSPAANEAREYMNDDRSYREHYHFAAVNWARFLPQFGDTALTNTTKEKLADQAFKYSAYLNGGGTENHKTMWLTSANVLPHYLAGDRGLSHESRDVTLRAAKEELRRYVKGLYAAGAGEWDSPTYTMFTGHGLMNVYDYSEDPETRLIAKAGLDWIVAYYALKHVDGLFAPPNQRGHYREAHDSIVDQTGYLWWGGDRVPEADAMQSWRYAVHAALSNYRPNAVLTDIATRQLPDLPIELRNSKPNYWYGLRQEPRSGVYPESLYIDKHFTLASLWSGHSSQITRFGVAVATDQGGVLITGGHPRRSDHTGNKIDFGYEDGISRYLQSAQVGPTYVALASMPEVEAIDHAFVSIPPGTQAVEKDGWVRYAVGEVTIAVRGIGKDAVVGEALLTEKQQAQNRKAQERGKPLPHAPMPIIKVEGRRVGFVVEVIDSQDAEEIASRLSQTKLDDAALGEATSFAYHTAAGHQVNFAFNPDPEGDNHGDRPAKVSIDGEPVTFDDSPIASGPYVSQTPGVLTVHNGREGFVIDFTGDLPVYRQWAE